MFPDEFSNLLQSKNGLPNLMKKLNIGARPIILLAWGLFHNNQIAINSAMNVMNVSISNIAAYVRKYTKNEKLTEIIIFRAIEKGIFPKKWTYVKCMTSRM